MRPGNDVEEEAGMNVFGRSRAAALALTATAALCFAAGAQARATSASSGCSARTLVHTNSGPVCGVTKQGQTSYLDLRYAAPPVGALRWMPPQPVHPWTSTYRATSRGRQCALPTYPQGALSKGTGEDCLFLEVQEPAQVRPRTQAAGDGRDPRRRVPRGVPRRRRRELHQEGPGHLRLHRVPPRRPRVPRR